MTLTLFCGDPEFKMLIQLLQDPSIISITNKMGSLVLLSHRGIDRPIRKTFFLNNKEKQQIVDINVVGILW